MMNNDANLIFEAYKKVNEPRESLMKFTYEFLEPVYIKDPKSKYGWINTGKFQSRTGGGPDMDHVFASSKEEAIKMIVDRLPGVKDVEKRIVIKSEELADPEEVEHELKHSQAMSDYYSDRSKSGGYSGD
jgi:hypothetical protein